MGTRKIDTTNEWLELKAKAGFHHFPHECVAKALTPYAQLDRRAWHEGVASHGAGYDLTQCPHHANSHAAFAWCNGWHVAEMMTGTRTPSAAQLEEILFTR